MNRFALRFLVLACASCAPVLLLAQPPAVQYSVPAAVQPGQAVDVTFFGGNLANVSATWTNLPLAVELASGIENNGKAADRVTYRLTVPADAPLGVGGFRIATGAGGSNTRLIMIDDLPTVLDNGQNKSRETAQEVVVPNAVEGACEAESSDFYRFAGKAGQRVTIEVYAQRLGYPLDPMIRVLDASGKELAYADDVAGVGVDSRLAFVPPADGAYTIELRDVRWQGGGLHRYRLRLGNFPLATVAYPLGVTRGVPTPVTVAGTGDFVPPVTVTMPPVAGTAAPSLPVFSFSAKLPQGQGSGIVSLVASTSPELLEIEPNDAAELGTAVSLPASLNGRFHAARDKDWFQFTAKANERWLFRGRTRSLGSPTDLFLRLYNGAGGLIAEAEDAAAEEGLIDFRCPADGVYRLSVEDLHRRGGPDHAYRIEVIPYGPGFSLAVEQEKYDAPQGGVFVAKVTTARREYNGPIELSLLGLDGAVLANNVIAEGKPETIINVTLPPAMAAGQLNVITIVGKAKIGETEVTELASTITPLRVACAAYPYPPSALDGRVGIGVGPVFPDYFKLAADPFLFPTLVGTSTVTVKAERLNGFNDPIQLAVEGLPAGVTAEVQPIAAGQAMISFALKGPENQPEGETKIKITGRGVFQNQPKTVVLAELPLRVIKPLALTVAPAGPIAKGNKQKVKITATRFGDDKGPIALAFKNLPQGVTAPENPAIAEGQNEVEIELTAAADAPAGKIENLVVGGTATVKGNAIAVDSAPVAFEVQ